ncbi:hypothetical protein [Streptomyces violascens]|uniref:hypothetical protein n=1 Tax=Streptomyces violascens TaxID=67381 RepID=UPI0036A211E3
MDATARTATAEPTHTRAEAVTVYRPEPMPGHPAEHRPATAPETLPTVVEVRTLDGRTVYHYADLSALAGTAPATPAPAPAAVPGWAKTTALLLVSASASMVLAAYATQVFANAAAQLAAALLLLAKIAFVLALLVALVAAYVVSKRRGGGAQSATATATATAKGWRAKATATATATINNR